MRILRPHEVTELPELREMTPEELAEGYALDKASFTAADLQLFTEVDECVPVEELVAELEEAQIKHDQGKA